jgi:hypothetical protein
LENEPKPSRVRLTEDLLVRGEKWEEFLEEIISPLVKGGERCGEKLRD